MINRPAVFLDRDGVLIEDTGYLSSFDQIKIINGAYEAIHLLNHAGFFVIVISNQSGVARGYFPIDFVINTHLLLQNKFLIHNAKIDKFYFCPHHPEGSIAEYAVTCNCRKPEPGLILRATREFNINLKSSFLIGDKYSDIQTGLNNNITPIWVKTGKGYQEIGQYNTLIRDNQIIIHENLLGAVENII